MTNLANRGEQGYLPGNWALDSLRIGIRRSTCKSDRGPQLCKGRQIHAFQDFTANGQRGLGLPTGETVQQVKTLEVHGGDAFSSTPLLI